MIDTIPQQNTKSVPKDKKNVYNIVKNKIQIDLTSTSCDKGDITEQIVDYIKSIKHIKTIRQDQKREIWIYEDGIWVPNGKSYVEEIARDILQRAYSTHYLNVIIAKVMSDTFVNQEDFFKNEDINLIPVKNGILNIVTLKLEEFSPKYYFFNKINATFDISKKCPNIIKHLENVLSDKEDVPVIQEMFGFCLLREYTIEKAFMLTGSGRNGKGKTIDLLKRFLGAENCTNIPIQALTFDSFNLINLHNKMANISADLSSTALKETGQFKSLTGRDLITANRKGKSFVSFVNYAKMIFCANQLPASPDDTEAFWNRWVLLQFPYTFLSEDEFNNRDKEEQKMCKIADAKIIDKLTTEEEMSGLLNWSLKGLHKLLENSDFSYSNSVESVRNSWIRASDSVMSFAMDCVEEIWDSNLYEKDYATVSEVKNAYYDYCNKNKLQKESDQKFNSIFSKKARTNSGRRTINTDDGEKKQIRVWNNINIKK